MTYLRLPRFISSNLVQLLRRDRYAPAIALISLGNLDAQQASIHSGFDALGIDIVVQLKRAEELAVAALHALEGTGALGMGAMA